MLLLYACLCLLLCSCDYVYCLLFSVVCLRLVVVVVMFIVYCLFMLLLMWLMLFPNQCEFRVGHRFTMGWMDVKVVGVPGLFAVKLRCVNFPLWWKGSLVAAGSGVVMCVFPCDVSQW